MRNFLNGGHSKGSVANQILMRVVNDHIHTMNPINRIHTMNVSSFMVSITHH